MAHRVVLTLEAGADVDLIVGWLRSQSSDAAAARWLRQFRTRAASLGTFPERCPLAAEAQAVGFELREALLGKGAQSYRLLFIIRNESTVEILRVRHTSRDALDADHFE